MRHDEQSDPRDPGQEAERWRAFWQGLRWEPIAAYDKAAGEPVVLTAADDWALGYWGDADPGDALIDPPPPAGPMWRHAQDHRQELPLEFEPDRFAAVDDEWRERLMMD